MNTVYKAWWKEAANPWVAEIEGEVTYHRTRDEARKAAGLKPARKRFPDQPLEQIQAQPS